MERRFTAVLLLILIGVVILSGCTGIGDSEKILFDAYEKSSRLEKYNITYNMTIVMEMGSMIQSVGGKVYALKIDDVSKATMVMQAGSLYGSMGDIEYYRLPEGEIQCAESFMGNYECVETEPSVDPFTGSTTQTPNQQIALVKEWMEKEVVDVKYLGTEKIMGRKCNCFLFDVDINKVLENMSAEMSGVTFDPEETTYTIEMCLDKEYGVALSTKVTFSIENMPMLGGSFVMLIQFETIDFNLDVDESALELPVSYDEIEWLPKVAIKAAECNPGYTDIKLSIKANKDIESTSAVLNVSWSEYTYVNGSYGIKTHNMSAPTLIPVMKKGETTDLVFKMASALPADEMLSLSLGWDDSSTSSYCTTYLSSTGTLAITGQVGKILDKILKK